MNRKFTVTGLALMVSAGSLQAQRVSIDAAVRTSDKSYVQAIGEATVSAKPDQAIIDIGVVTQGATAASAATQNAKQTDAALADLHKILTPRDQLKTTSYSVRPNYQTPKPGATATIGGYTATNVVEVVLDDLSLVGNVIDAALQSGANNIQKLQVGLKNPQAIRSQALRDAAVQAKASAQAIAAGLGVQIVRVLSAEEYSPADDVGRVNYQAKAPLAPGAPTTPVEVGTVEVTAIVTLKVEVTQ
jgi:uncharacterized protein YggE